MVILYDSIRAVLAGTIGLLACSSEPDACADQPVGTACTWLGLKGQAGFNGEGLRRYETQVNQVQDLVFLDDGSGWYSDLNNHLVRRIHPDGTVQTMIGWSDPIFPGDGPVGGPSLSGAPGSQWQLTHPTALYAGSEGMLLVAAWHNYKVLTVDVSSGLVQILAGGEVGFLGDGGAAVEAQFRRPNDITEDDAGNLYVVDQQNQRIRVIDSAGTIDTFAGIGDMGFAGDGGPARDAQFSWADNSSPNPSGNILHHDGTLFVADTEAHRIRGIDLSDGLIDTIAGTGEMGFAGDGGTARDAMLNGPRDLEIGPDGDLYFADTDNGAIRAVDLDTSVIRTVVGTGELGVDEDEQRPAEQTRLRRPFGITFDPEGDLYVMDTLNNRIVRVRSR